YTLDHFDPAEIDRRNLHETERYLFTEEWQAVGQESRVASAHPLNADAGRAQRGRCRLHPQASSFVQQHDDVSRRHHGLLLDPFPIHHLDAHRLILDAAIGARGRHRHVLFDGDLAHQIDDDGLLFARAYVDVRGRWNITRLHDRELNAAGRDTD